MDEVGNTKFLSEGETKLQTTTTTTTTTTNPTTAFFLTLYVFGTKLCRCKPHLLVVLVGYPTVLYTTCCEYTGSTSTALSPESHACM